MSKENPRVVLHDAIMEAATVLAEGTGHDVTITVSADADNLKMGVYTTDGCTLADTVPFVTVDEALVALAHSVIDSLEENASELRYELKEELKKELESIRDLVDVDEVDEDDFESLLGNIEDEVSEVRRRVASQLSDRKIEKFEEAAETLTSVIREFEVELRLAEMAKKPVEVATTPVTPDAPVQEVATDAPPIDVPNMLATVDLYGSDEPRYNGSDF